MPGGGVVADQDDVDVVVPILLVTAVVVDALLWIFGLTEVGQPDNSKGAPLNLVVDTCLSMITVLPRGPVACTRKKSSNMSGRSAVTPSGENPPDVSTRRRKSPSSYSANSSLGSDPARSISHAPLAGCFGADVVQLRADEHGPCKGTYLSST